MISVVICSRASIIPDSLDRNIAETIGVEYEMIIIDNFLNNYSLFEAYNMGLSKSTGEIICFLHDDIYIHSKDWGNILQEIFDFNPEAGLIGIAGSRIKTRMPSAWWDSPEELKVINIIQHFQEPHREKEKWYKGFETGAEVEVAVIDGVFMALRKATGIRLNTKMKGFHNYDLNLALECAKLNYKVLATNRILLEHYSIGNQNKNWYQSTLDLDYLYGKYLPITTDNSLNNFSLRKQEFENGIFFIKGLLKHNFKKQAIYYWVKLIALKPYSKFHFNFLKSLILK